LLLKAYINLWEGKNLVISQPPITHEWEEHGGQVKVDNLHIFATGKKAQRRKNVQPELQY
jgi:hypothetical protein